MRSPANPLALTYRYCGRMTGKPEVIPGDPTAPLSGRRWRTRVPQCWPPSAAQTVHADFPHTAFTKTQISERPKKELIELAD
jgi:hypothetical protein